MPKCPSCGARNPRENTVCRSCGAVLMGEEPTVAVPTPEPVEASDEWAEASDEWGEVEPAVAEGEALVEGEGEGEEEEEGIVTCVRCEAEVDPEVAYVVPGRARGGGAVVLCEKCVGELEAQIEAETQDLNLGQAALFGLGAAIASGAVWFLVEHFFDFSMALMAFVGGWLIAEAVRYGAGKKRGRPLQFMALGLTALLILGANYALIGQANPEALSDLSAFADTFGEQLQDTFTLILYALGLWQAYSTPAPRRVMWQRREPQESEEEAS